jgi:hypothetical protein
MGCTDSGKKVAVEQFDYEKTTPVAYLNNEINQVIDEKYNVANKHFHYVADVDGQCSMFNKVGEASNEAAYVTSVSNGQHSLDVNLYLKQDGVCRKVQTLNNVVALSNKQVVYDNRVYLNVISGEDGINKSGLWVLDGKNKKLISKFKTMGADFDIDPLTGTLYSIEHTAGGTSYLRAYNQNDTMLNQYQIEDEEYDKLFIKNGQLSLVLEQEVDKVSGESIFNYIISVIPLNNLFKDLQAQEYKEVIEIEARNSSFSAMQVRNDYMVFYGDSSVVCKTDYSKCVKYPHDIIELFGGQGYIGINGGPSDDEGMYLNKFGTNGVEKLLNQAQSYFTRQEGKDIYFQVFNRDDESKTKTIKYTIK